MVLDESTSNPLDFIVLLNGEDVTDIIFKADTDDADPYVVVEVGGSQVLEIYDAEANLIGTTRSFVPKLDDKGLPILATHRKSDGANIVILDKNLLVQQPHPEDMHLMMKGGMQYDGRWILTPLPVSE